MYAAETIAEFVGNLFKITLKRGPKGELCSSGLLAELSVEDDGNWHVKTSFDAEYWMNDLYRVVLQASQHNAQDSPQKLLCDELNRLLALEKQKTTDLYKWISDMQSGMYVNCVYCGHRYGPVHSTPVSMADILKEHIEGCSKHPMSSLKADLRAAMIDIASHGFKSSGYLNEEQNACEKEQHLAAVGKLFDEACKRVVKHPA